MSTLPLHKALEIADENNRLLADNARLREALREIANGPNAETLAQTDSYSETARIWRWFGVSCRDKARELLEGKP